MQKLLEPMLFLNYCHLQIKEMNQNGLSLKGESRLIIPNSSEESCSAAQAESPS